MNEIASIYTNTPPVSIVIPTCARPMLLKRAVESVLQQTCGDYLAYIVSDGPNQESKKYVEGLKDRRFFYSENREMLGASAARNTAMRQIRTPYIAFLDDDDEWTPDKLERQISIIERCGPKVGLIYAWMDYYDGNQLIKRYRPSLKGDVFVEMLDKQAIGACSTIMIKRKVIDKIGYFDETLLRGNDGDYCRRISQRYHVDYVPHVLVKMHVNHGHKRITSRDEIGLRNAIRAQEVKFEKFPDELRTHRLAASQILCIIASHYSELGKWSLSLSYYIRAWCRCPWNFWILKSLISTLKHSLKLIDSH